MSSLGYQYAFNTGALQAAAAASAANIEIALSPVVVEVVIPAMAPSYDQAIALEPVIVEVVIPAIGVPSVINIALEPVIVELVIPAIGVARHINLSPVIVEVVITTPIVTKYRPEVAGSTAMFVQQADGSEIAGLPGPVLEVAAWETHRYLNRVGNWTAAISASQHPVAGRPLAQLIQRGWKVSLIQENNPPLFREDLEYLMYQGIVEDKEYSADESGQALCRLSGSFRALELVQRSTPTSATYEGVSVAAAAEDIVGGMAGGISYPSNASSNTITLRFNQDGDGVQSRFARLVKLGSYARYALRETWEQDALEFVQIDNPPDSGYVLINQEAAGHAQVRAAAAGFALVGGSPLEVKREGRGIINRVIPFGATERRTYIDPETITDPPTLVMGVQPANGRLININGRAYVFTTGAPIAGYVPIGATLADTRENLREALAATDGINTSPHPQVRLGAWSGDSAPFEFLAPTEGFYVGGSYLLDAGNTWTEGSPAEFELNVPLTLEHSTKSGLPFTIYSGVNADGSTYWFIEDAGSISRHGLIEVALHRTDVRNPSDNAVTRAAAADVLYAVAAGTLLRQAAAKVFVTVPIANGAQVWALPGDKIKLQYTGNVAVAEGVVTWEEFDKWFLVVERHDRSDPSGVRQVELVLAAPEIEMTIPALPEAVILPVTRGPESGIDTLLNELGLGDDATLGEDGIGGESAPDCCDDPLEDIEEGPPVPEEIEWERDIEVDYEPWADDPWSDYLVQVWTTDRYLLDPTPDVRPRLVVTHSAGETIAYSSRWDSRVYADSVISPETARSGSPGSLTTFTAEDAEESDPAGFDRISPSRWGIWTPYFEFDTSGIPDDATVSEVRLEFWPQFVDEDSLPVWLLACATEMSLPATTDQPRPSYTETILGYCEVTAPVDMDSRSLVFTSTGEFAPYINKSGYTTLYLVRAGIYLGNPYTG